MAEASVVPASPCTRRCTLDDATLVCVGCLRHLDEIIGWQAASTTGKLEILARVAERRQAQKMARPAGNL